MAIPKPMSDSETKISADQPAARKATGAAARSTRNGTRNGQKAQGARKALRRGLHTNGNATSLLNRGKAALGDAYDWAEEAGSALPRAMKNMSMPDRSTIRNIFDEQPLVWGALGLGLGVLLGAILPSSRSQRGSGRGAR